MGNSKEYKRKYRLRNKDKIKAYNTKYWRENKHRLREWKHNYDKKYDAMRRKKPEHKHYYFRKQAEYRNIYYGLTFDEFLTFWQLPCYYCGDEIETVGLDRIDNNQGYIIDNIVPCCHPCNMMKRTYEQEEFIARCTRIAEKFK